MTPSTYIRTTVMGQEPDLKACSQVEVTRFEGDPNPQVIDIPWWPSLLDQWGRDGVRAYLEAEALYVFGFVAEAQDKLRPIATGSIVTDESGNVVSDDRSWAQRWIDEHPVVIIAPMVDPLA